MQNFFIIILCFALLGSVLSKCDTRHVNLGRSFFNMLGFKSKEQIQKEQLEKLVDKYLKDQGQYLGSSQEDMGSLSKIVEESSALDNGPDFLRLKALLKDFSDQNVLMVENGKELMSSYEQQKKINQKRAEEADKASFLSRSNQKELLDKQKDALEKEEEILKNLHNQIQQMKDNSTLNKNPELKEKLNQMMGRTSEHLDKLKEQQEHIKDTNERNSEKYESMKEKMDDLRRKNQDEQERIKDRTKQMNDRIRDQLDRIKDKR